MKIKYRIIALSLIILNFYCVSFSQNNVITELLYEDDFSNGLSDWIIEQTEEGITTSNNDCLEINGGGCTIWFKELLNGPVLIEYKATLVQNGGLYDNCRDLNCFFMARFPRAPYDLFEAWRSNSKSRGGSFKKYHELRTYYAGIGGHKNTTTRFRRYTGHGDRTLLPQHDIVNSDFLLEANKSYTIRIVANNNIIQVFLDNKKFFEINDPEPYTSGWFGFRTVANHLIIDDFKVYRIQGQNLDKEKLHKMATQLGINKGLTELHFRGGYKYQPDFKKDKTYLSEKLVFIDHETNGLVWRMTNDPAIETNEYTDIPVWSANGETMLFITARNGKNERWLMDANGANLRPLSSIVSIPNDKGVWSLKYPDILYYVEKEIENGNVIATKVMSANVKTGKKQIVVKVNKDLGKMMPPNPSEELFLFGDHMGGAWTDKEHSSRAFIVDLKGNVSEVNFEKLYHRLRFTKSQDGRVFFNFDKPRTSWTCLPDGTDRQEIKINGGHPDWLEGGEWVIFNAREVLPDGTKNFDLRYDAIRYDGTGLKTLYPFGGHASTCLNGRHIVCDGGKGAGSINFVDTDSNNTSQVLFMNHTSRYDHTNNWHPNHHSTHPHPNSSPDGTKVMSNSDVLGQYSDIFVSIAKFPDTPLKLNSAVKGKQIVLNWDKPFNNREIKGYFIYHSETSGMKYKKLTEELITTTNYTLPVNYEGYFVVTAVEYSGLESAPSNEAYFKGNEKWEGKIRIPFEAESGFNTLPFERKIDMVNASNGYIIESRDNKANGKLIFEIDIPVDGRYNLWSLVTGRGSISIEINHMEGSLSGPDNFWSWQKANTVFQLKKGKNRIVIAGTTGIEKIDKFYLTNDLQFQPVGHSTINSSPPEPPGNLKAVCLQSNNVQLEWNNISSAAYYNVYVSSTHDFECNQHQLIGSPIENEFIDWGIENHSTLFYKIKSVNHQGIESKNATTISIKTNLIIPRAIILSPKNSEFRNVGLDYEKQLSHNIISSHEKHAFVEWEFKVEQTGYYSIWGQSIVDAGQSTYFEISLNDTIINWNHYGIYNTWKWSPIGEKTSGTPELFYLKAGLYKLKVTMPKIGSKIGKLVITNDTGFYPADEIKSTGY